MGVNRYEKLNQFFHLSDPSNEKNADEEGYDPLYKIRLLYDRVREECLKQPPAEHQCIDEQLIPFIGRKKFKQYLPNKPKSKEVGVQIDLPWFIEWYHP